jgi:hypothetical protein
LTDDKTENEIATILHGDKQLAQMWVSFVLHNHWAERKATGDRSAKWVMTDKGKHMLKQYK